jgi:hypothetical protein
MRLVKPNLLDLVLVCRHLRAMDAKEIFATRFDDDPDRLAAEVLRIPAGWVACHHDLPVAYVGAVEMWPGMWAPSVFGTDAFPSVGLGLTQFIRRRMIPSLLELGMRRAEAKSIDGHDDAHRWMEVLGARREGVPHLNYGKGGETFHTFVWEF